MEVSLSCCLNPTFPGACWCPQLQNFPQDFHCVISPQVCWSYSVSNSATKHPVKSLLLVAVHSAVPLLCGIYNLLECTTRIMESTEKIEKTVYWKYFFADDIVLCSPNHKSNYQKVKILALKVLSIQRKNQQGLRIN